MARPTKEQLRERAEREAGGNAQAQQPTSDNLSAPIAEELTPTGEELTFTSKRMDREAAAPSLGHNTEYSEYHIKVSALMRKIPGGGNEVYGYTGKLGELIRDKVRIEAFRAEASNAKWYSTKRIFVEKGDLTTEFKHLND